MKFYKDYTSIEISDLDKKVDEVISNPENFSDDYVDNLINKVSELGQSFHLSEYGNNVSWLHS